MSLSWKRALAILLLVLTLVVAGLAVAAWSILPLDGTAITIDGDRWSLADLTGTHAAIFFSIAVAVVVAVVVAAIAAGVVGLGIALLGLVFSGLVTAGTLLLVAAPFVLIGWLLWRLARARPAPLPIARS